MDKDSVRFTVTITRSMWDRIHHEAARRDRIAQEMAFWWILSMLLAAEAQTDEELNK